MSEWESEAWEESYKYSCRKCPIRNRCILQSHTSPAIKDMIRNAFANRTDTRQTWGILQENCLLIKEEEEEQQKAQKESMLSRRLREARETKGQVSPQAAIPLQTTLFRPSGEVVPAPELASREIPAWAGGTAKAYCLVVQPGRRRIALPNSGGLVLGRFDPNVNSSADVDLHYDDQKKLSVSRRHARVLGLQNGHTIEDLGSTNGTRLNGRALEIGEVAPLKPGDLVTLGNCELSYEPMPSWTGDLSPGARRRYFLLVTATGRRFDLTGSGEVTIGRSDPMIGFKPEVDLAEENEVNVRVSRKHARLIREGEGYLLEDLGSKFGTRLNGAAVGLGSRVRLKPGDHIWLAGCVLAYDLET